MASNLRLTFRSEKIANSPWRAALDRRLERRALGSARGIVTVSETWAQAYRERYGKPTAVIYNGFMPEDYEQQPSEPPPGDRDNLRIVYTGALYAGRDPAPLWQALRLMGPAADSARIEFYGTPAAAVLASAAQHGVSDRVAVRGALPHEKTVRLQSKADVLLMLQWNDPCEKGNLPGKLAKHLLENSHDVRIIAAERTGPPRTLPLEVSLDRVLYTPWWDINGIPRALARLRRRHLGLGIDGDACAEGTVGPNIGTTKGQPESILKRMALFYQNLFNWPDARVGWLPFALIGARKHLKDWVPDIIYASSPPPTCLVAAVGLARRLSVPSVSEIRDRWADDPYDQKPQWRVALDRWLERRVLSSARAIVTVSETWAQAYRERYGKPTAVIYNGFVPEDYELQPPETPPSVCDSFCIVHTGNVYAGRDPEPLWQALRLMGWAADGIWVEMCGAEPMAVLSGAARYGVSELVRGGTPCLTARRCGCNAKPTSCCCCSGTTLARRDARQQIDA